MSDTNRLWVLKDFPDDIGSGSDVVQRAYQDWKYQCERDPSIDAAPVDAGGERHQVIIWGSRHPDDYSANQQFACDFDINPRAYGLPGEVVYRDSGWI
ncbi:hypothetical protein [Actinoplanes couchii]|uniref:Uncharacterized protein n=1 Tax=Actinoplanes couchii TaxID=403638 RepID=A0ABQ3XKX5_9ACTN|nr:hypothetical protein [Actinoplanes couchii]MDR6319461.1 hypothetical protein [Actinoplanes couchii]GID59148.1 hypothetical protein Aco03nite_075520 [Actinoplanes couchii]